MADDYIILRSVASRPKMDDERLGDLSAKPRAAEDDQPRLKVELSDVEAAHGHFDDPDTRAIARVMPMRLIEPAERKSTVAKTDAVHPNVAWGVAAVKAVDTPFTGSGVTVAVLDSGIDSNLHGHGQAFHGVELIMRDFTGEGMQDDDGHGTHCAGTIFGRTVDGIRIGVAPGVTRALLGKVLGKNGASSLILAQAIEWAVNEGAQIISMSLGIDFPGAVEQWKERGEPLPAATSRALLQYRDTVRLFDKIVELVAAKSVFARRSVLIVAAAGNESKRDRRPPWTIGASPPANADGVLSVAAVGLNGESYEVAAFSNTNVRLAAPGVDIPSAKPGGDIAVMSGTSMATPHAAGVAACWAQKLGRSTEASELLEAVVNSAKALPGLKKTDVGRGLVQAPAANGS